MADTKANANEENLSPEQLITEHLDIWTTAIEQKSSAGRGSSKKFSLHGIKKLRELILELAVRGKLVPQDPNDEPASVLLERIAAEKAQLVKDKNFTNKKQKPKVLPEINEDEKPFELLKGWAWSSNALLFNLIKGKKPKVLSEKNIGYPYLDIEALDRNNILRYTDDEKCPRSTEKDILVVCDGSRSGLILDGKDGVIGSTLALINTPYYLQEYIKLFFKQAFHRLNSSMKGAAIPHLDTKSLREGFMATPPLKEQHRIVAKVDELMNLCDALEAQTENSIAAHQTLVEVLLEALLKAAEQTATPEQATAQFQQNWQRLSEHFDTLFTTTASIDTLKQTILQLAVMGKLVPWDKGACKGELKEYLSFGPRNGFSPKEAAVITDVRVLKLGATSYGSLNLDQTKHVDVNIEFNSHLWLSEGDILIQRGNSASYVGCNCLIKKDISGVIYPDLMMKLRAADGLNPKYLSIWLSAPKSRRFMWDRMTGTSGTMPKISKKIVEKIPIVVPSISVQEVIITKVDELMTLCDQLKARLTDEQTTKLQLTDAIVEQAVN
ncbi:restriction endonuclease subunit S [uncultured Psychromonas sp.]|uniref:restriction endonuclease subunit S n=1 Tax=uncultured Psychromonas sp. TaxID=173974 RepID=UPI002628863D|nr:restriction endonuclease subunit S [uncultured Psychromonas sp.]